MSHAATKWALDQKGLKPATRIVLFCLADRHNPDHGCFPSHKRLAEDAEMSERSVRSHLDILEARGLISRQPGKGQNGMFGSTRYVFQYEGDFQRQNLPSAKSTNGKKALSPSASSSEDQRQNLPTNPVRDKPVREQVRDIRAILCEVVSEEVADAFIDYRKTIKAKLTERAATLIANKLRGNPHADAIVDMAIEKAWRGVYPESFRPPEEDQARPKIRARLPGEAQ